MTTFTKSLLWVAASVSFWLALTSTLDAMTSADCNAGIQAACEQLQKSGIKTPYMD